MEKKDQNKITANDRTLKESSLREIEVWKIYPLMALERLT
jgi:hypothetical protein